jgi:hypothetical protein
MRENVSGRYSKRIHRVGIAIVAGGILASPMAFADPSNAMVIVPPGDLPELARHTGEAMLLDHTVDGKTLLFVEQNQGGRLAIFDVTDPVRIKDEGSAQLDAPGPFDFVWNAGNQAELVQFRQGQGEAILDMHNAKKPTLKKIEGSEVQGSTKWFGTAGNTVTNPLVASTRLQPVRDYQVVEAATSKAATRVFDVKQVREEATNTDTGTTFLLTENGLYIIRRPALETAQPIYLNTGG